MKYTDESLGVSFVVPDKITVRKQLEYKGALLGREKGFYVRLWDAAKTVVESWECSELKLDTDIDSITSKRAADIVEFVGIKVSNHMGDLETLPKN